jgi:hypothetical protein
VALTKIRRWGMGACVFRRGGHYAGHPISLNGSRLRAAERSSRVSSILMWRTELVKRCDASLGPGQLGSRLANPLRPPSANAATLPKNCLGRLGVCIISDYRETSGVIMHVFSALNGQGHPKLLRIGMMTAYVPGPRRERLRCRSVCVRQSRTMKKNLHFRCDLFSRFAG